MKLTGKMIFDTVSIAQSRKSSFPPYAYAGALSTYEFQSLNRANPLSHVAKSTQDLGSYVVSIAQSRKSSFPQHASNSLLVCILRSFNRSIA